jgi:hemerythrin superfamily protein
MDIYSYLRKDHRKISDLMEQVVNARGLDRREELFDEIAQELLLHAETEQATFYAALESEEETEEKIEDAEQDHAEVTEYIERLSRVSVESEKWLEIFGELKHAVEHHVRDEETRIFEKAMQVLDDDEAEQLADEMDRLKEQAMEDAA